MPVIKYQYDLKDYFPEKYWRLRKRKEMNVGEDIGVDGVDGEGRVTERLMRRCRVSYNCRGLFSPHSQDHILRLVHSSKYTHLVLVRSNIY